MSKVVEVAGKYQWPDSGVPILDAITTLIGVLQPFTVGRSGEASVVAAAP